MSTQAAARWSSLTAALAGLLGGIATAGDDRLSAALFAVGFLLTGVWLVLVIRSADTPPEPDAGLGILDQKEEDH